MSIPDRPMGRIQDTRNDDLGLMTSIARRDELALAALYDRHSAAVFSLCLRVVRAREVAEEVLEDVFFEAWERPERFDATRATPLAYLLVLARSRSIDRLRSARTRSGGVRLQERDHVADASFNMPDEGLLRSERERQLRAALAALDESERAVIEAAFFEGLTHQQIADKTKRPLGTVKSLIRRGLQRLYNSLGGSA